jgi:hypothetical protein
VTLTPPLTPFVDPLPAPRRLIAAEHGGRLSVPIRTGTHRFHRDLAESTIWGYDATMPAPVIETERGQAVTVEWRNELDGPLPVTTTVAPESVDAEGLPVQCVPGLSGGERAPRPGAAASAKRPSHGERPADAGGSGTGCCPSSLKPSQNDRMAGYRVTVLIGVSRLGRLLACG